NLGDNQAAADYVNVVRERAAIDPSNKSVMDVPPDSINIDFLLDERAREFAGEQIRWFDLKRTGKLVERVKAHNPDAAPFIQPFDALRPIPQRELDAVSNKDEFTQNPGYN
ncbi:MAG TPA: RagB/SusD family nutrient uptake outer membrane protein, partial [Longimicrobiaceae bacterium]|nr:RagB/SusD family nutrient uptake outer membrane protein [Longimicrobiaceae bacterium]